MEMTTEIDTMNFVDGLNNYKILNVKFEWQKFVTTNGILFVVITKYVGLELLIDSNWLGTLKT